MAEVGICKRIIKNFAAQPGGVPAANDFAIEITHQKYPNLIPTGTIHLGYSNNEAEVERLAQAGIRGIALDSCWQGFDVSDPNLREVYKLISHYKMFVLAHTGIDPEGLYKDSQTWPEHIKRAKGMLPDSTIIAAHLGANEKFERAIEYKGASGILFDLAWIMESCDKKLISQGMIIEVINYLGVDRIVYGSDYPWTDPGAQLAFWEKLLPDEAWKKTSHENAVRELHVT